jgi:(1->4)-alpha-D-glucan 1-alpha-D-glucosylmutase
MVEAKSWGDTAVRLPSHLASARFEDILTQKTVGTGASLKLSEVLAELPLALLLAD